MEMLPSDPYKVNVEKHVLSIYMTNQSLLQLNYLSTGIYEMYTYVSILLYCLF